MTRAGSVRLHVAIPAALAADLDAAAAVTGVSRAAVVRLLLAGAVQANTGGPQMAVAASNRPGPGDPP